MESNDATTYNIKQLYCISSMLNLTSQLCGDLQLAVCLSTGDAAI